MEILIRVMLLLCLVRLTLYCTVAVTSSAMPAEAFVLFLDKKNQKSSHLPMLLFAQGNCAAKPGSTTGCLYLRRWLRPHVGHRYMQI